MSPLCRSRESYGEVWCWEACLETLGMNAPERWALLADAPYAGEFRRWISCDYRFSRVVPPGDGHTVAEVVERYPTGTYLVAGHDHVMILRDGVLTDTNVDGSGRRRVLWVDQLYPRRADR